MSPRPLHSNRATDVASASSFRAFKPLKLTLSLEVDFGQRELRGSAKWELRCLQDGETILNLDVHPSLRVGTVRTLGSSGLESRVLKHTVQPFTRYGEQLEVNLAEPCRGGEDLQLEIEYTAGQGPGIMWLNPCQTAQKDRPFLYTCGFPIHNRSFFPGFHTPLKNNTFSARIQVCWLDPEQTAGKQKPYVYTQGQAVLNRCFFPCFDTPAVKSTYCATIKVPEGFTAVMSATTWEKKENNTYAFRMDQPIPSYLVALAVGDITSAEVGPRTRVWAEPCLIQAAKQEFDGVIEEFLSTGEKLFGPYLWGRYDVLFMPPSFPFGGMENPCITFVTPCLLAGDRSLADVIIHEISHSWFGNLVTNANWGEFWLNEGFTMYAQRRISTALYGPAYTCLEAATGRALLRQHMDTSGEDHPLNKLRVKIEPGVDPDDTYNETPYEKGYCFVSYLAHLVGDQSKFDAFLQAYVNEFKFQSIMADDALEFYLEYFPELKAKKVETIPGLEFDRWLNTPGWPPFVPDLSAGDSLMKPADELTVLWAASTLNMEAIKSVDISTWKTYQLVYFLDRVLEKSPLPAGNIVQLGEEYPMISKAKNAELRLRWCQLVLKNNHEPHFGQVKDFLHSQGKQKYTLPIYRAMKNGSEAAKGLAVETFSATCSQLHENVQKYVKKILAPES